MADSAKTSDAKLFGVDAAETDAAFQFSGVMNQVVEQNNNRQQQKEQESNTVSKNHEATEKTSEKSAMNNTKDRVVKNTEEKPDPSQSESAESSDNISSSEAATSEEVQESKTDGSQPTEVLSKTNVQELPLVAELGLFAVATPVTQTEQAPELSLEASLQKENVAAVTTLPTVASDALKTQQGSQTEILQTTAIAEPATNTESVAVVNPVAVANPLQQAANVNKAENKPEGVEIPQELLTQTAESETGKIQETAESALQELLDKTAASQALGKDPLATMSVQNADKTYHSKTSNPLKTSANLEAVSITDSTAGAVAQQTGESLGGEFSGDFSSFQQDKASDFAGMEITVQGQNLQIGGNTEVTLPAGIGTNQNPIKVPGLTVADQAVNGTAITVQAGRKELTLQLNPENLGQLRINLTSVGEQQVSARFITQNADARQELESQINSLRQALEKQGIQLTHITVTMAGENSASRSTEQNGQNNAFNQNSQQETFQQLAQQQGSHQYQQAGREQNSPWQTSGQSGFSNSAQTQGMEGVDAPAGSASREQSINHNGRISVLI